MANHHRYSVRSDLVKALQKARGIGSSAARHAVRKVLGSSASPSTPIQPPISDAGAGLSDKEIAAQRTQQFCSAFSKADRIPAKVRAAIRGWLAKPDVLWASDEDMRKRCDVGDLSAWKRHARENAEFHPLLVKIPGQKIVWAHSVQYAAYLQERAMS